MLKADTHLIQSKFAKYCLDGNSVSIPGADTERLKHYRRLVFGVFSGILEQAYPITFNYLGKERWKKLIQSFVANHPCGDPQVWKMPQELVFYVFESNLSSELECVFLVDLLKFEWLEIEVYCMPDQLINAVTQTKGNLLASPLCFNPHHQFLSLSYPVHQLNKLNPAEHLGNYTILSYRDSNGKANFLSLDSVHAVALDSLIQNQGVTGLEVIEELGNLSDEFNTDEFKDSFEVLLNNLLHRNFILGQLEN